VPKRELIGRHWRRDVLHPESREKNGSYRRRYKCGSHRERESGPHPSTTATVPVSLGTLAVAVQVSQRHQYEITLADIKA
jgi:hypothetical protein